MIKNYDRVLEGHVQNIHINQDGSKLYLVDNNKSVTVLDSQSGKVIKTKVIEFGEMQVRS